MSIEAAEKLIRDCLNVFGQHEDAQNDEFVRKIAKQLVEGSVQSWRNAHAVTDWEFAQIGALLCDNDARDLALKVIRLQGQLEVSEQLRRNGNDRSS